VNIYILEKSRKWRSLSPNNFSRPIHFFWLRTILRPLSASVTLFPWDCMSMIWTLYLVMPSPQPWQTIRVKAIWRRRCRCQLFTPPAPWRNPKVYLYIFIYLLFVSFLFGTEGSKSLHFIGTIFFVFFSPVCWRFAVLFLFAAIFGICCGQ